MIGMLILDSAVAESRKPLQMPHLCVGWASPVGQRTFEYASLRVNPIRLDLGTFSKACLKTAVSTAVFRIKVRVP